MRPTPPSAACPSGLGPPQQLQEQVQGQSRMGARTPCLGLRPQADEARNGSTWDGPLAPQLGPCEKKNCPAPLECPIIGGWVLREEALIPEHFLPRLRPVGNMSWGWGMVVGRRRALLFSVHPFLETLRVQNQKKELLRPETPC